MEFNIPLHQLLIMIMALYYTFSFAVWLSLGPVVWLLWQWTLALLECGQLLLIRQLKAQKIGK